MGPIISNVKNDDKVCFTFITFENFSISLIPLIFSTSILVQFWHSTLKNTYLEYSLSRKLFPIGKHQLCCQDPMCQKWVIPPPFLWDPVCSRDYKSHTLSQTFQLCIPRYSEGTFNWFGSLAETLNCHYGYRSHENCTSQGGEVTGSQPFIWVWLLPSHIHWLLWPSHRANSPDNRKASSEDFYFSLRGTVYKEMKSE